MNQEENLHDPKETPNLKIENVSLQQSSNQWTQNLL